MCVCVLHITRSGLNLAQQYTRLSIRYWYVVCWTGKDQRNNDRAPTWSMIDVPLMFSCPADHLPDEEPCTVSTVSTYKNGMVEVPSVWCEEHRQYSTVVWMKKTRRAERRFICLRALVTRFGLGVENERPVPGATEPVCTREYYPRREQGQGKDKPSPCSADHNEQDRQPCRWPPLCWPWGLGIYTGIQNNV